MTFEKLCERAFEQVASRLASFIHLKVILKKNKSTKWHKEKTHFANGKKKPTNNGKKKKLHAKFLAKFCI